MYVADLKGKRHTFAVSGKLWKRSLVMVDSQTGTLWSHILGRGMQGELEGTRLEVIPSLMTDWKTWRDEHPETTALNMSRTAQRFKRDLYRSPAKYLVGMADGHVARGWRFDRLAQQPVVNDVFDKRPVVVVYEQASGTSAIYSRELRGQVLEFEWSEKGLRDKSTGTLWNVRTGEADAGQLGGTTLKPLPGIVSFTNAWRDFHPESTFWSVMQQPEIDNDRRSNGKGRQAR